MDLLMNGLLLAATAFAGTYCWILSRRVRELKSLDKGLGGAIVTLTRQVELARTTLEEAKSSSKGSRDDLSQMVQKADAAAQQLRLLIAASQRTPAPQPAPAQQHAPVLQATPAQQAALVGRAAENVPAADPVEETEPLAEARPARAPRREPTLASTPMEEPEGPAQPTLRLAPRPVAVVPPAIEPEQLPEPVAPATLAIPTLDRLVAGPLARPAAAHLAEVPKPRALAPIENPLRRLRAAERAAAEPTPAAPTAPAGTEDALLEALSALAGGR